jgi:hypothetical protein
MLCCTQYEVNGEDVSPCLSVYSFALPGSQFLVGCTTLNPTVKIQHEQVGGSHVAESHSD